MPREVIETPAISSSPAREKAVPSTVRPGSLFSIAIVSAPLALPKRVSDRRAAHALRAAIKRHLTMGKSGRCYRCALATSIVAGPQHVQYCNVALALDFSAMWG